MDDNFTKRLALRAALAPLGYPVIEADSGRAALASVMVQDFAVILLDVCMPEMDGFETASFIRQRRESEMTPIIFVTAFANEQLMKWDRYPHGRVDFMFAPVVPSTLRSKVSAFASLFGQNGDSHARARDWFSETGQREVTPCMSGSSPCQSAPP